MKTALFLLLLTISITRIPSLFAADTNKWEGRDLIRGQWMRAAEVVVEKTKDPEARILLGFLKTNTELASPGTNFSILADNEALAYLVPLIEKDKNNPDMWRTFATNGMHAGFVTSGDLRVIFFKDFNAMSDTWKGIVLLHEAWHAYRAVFRLDHYTNVGNIAPIDFQERDTRLFEQRLLMKLGGETYQKLLDVNVLAMKKLFDDAGPSVKIGYDFVGPDGPLHKELQMLFGGPKSVHEIEAREGTFWFHVTYVFLDRYYKDDVTREQRKALITKPGYVLSRKRVDTVPTVPASPLKK